MAPVEAFLECPAREAQLSPRTVRLPPGPRPLPRMVKLRQRSRRLRLSHRSRPSGLVAAEHGRGLGSKSIARALVALRRLLRYLIQEADLARNPAEGVRPLAAPGVCRAPSMWMAMASS